MNQPQNRDSAVAPVRRIPAHVVVCGYSRSGTTLFYNMLRTTVTNFEFIDHECTATSVIGETPASYITKRPLDILKYDEIVRSNHLGKSLHFIIMIRDVRAVVTSRHKMVPDDYFVGFDHQYFFKDQIAKFINPGVLAIHQAISRVLAIARPMPIVLKYEDLVQRSDEVQRALGRQVGFEYSGRFAQFFEHDIPDRLQVALNGKRPLDPSSIDGWRAPQHRERIRQQFLACPALFSILRAYGYEEDDRWFEEYRADSPPERSDRP